MANDRISNLPRNIINLILERMPLYDAARTSTLSKSWRNIWQTHPHLVFDDVFLLQVVSKVDNEDSLFGISRTINHILLLHIGPISKFHLSIPQHLPFHLSLPTECWIKSMSNKGVRIFEIFNYSRIPYKMPSHLFSFSDLTHLSLRNCILNAPVDFEGFHSMISVVLYGVEINADITFGSQLETLDLRHCTGTKHFDSRWFECTKKLQTLCLVMSRFATPGDYMKLINLDMLLCNMPSIHFICFDGIFLKVN